MRVLDEPVFLFLFHRSVAILRPFYLGFPFCFAFSVFRLGTLGGY